MNRLDLDFAGRRRPVRWLGLVLLVVAGAAAAKLMHVYSAAAGEAAILEARIAQLERRGSGASARATALPESTVREIRHANEAIGQLTLPWERLFKAMEAAAGSKVALLGITPDPKGGTVEVSGECADLATVFDYVSRLSSQPGLVNVYLINHQVNAQDPQRPVRFTVSASWMPPASRT
jgi:Tfp pilus assembly protein PilN